MNMINKKPSLVEFDKFLHEDELKMIEKGTYESLNYRTFEKSNPNTL